MPATSSELPLAIPRKEAIPVSKRSGWPLIMLTALALFVAIKAIPYVTTHTDFFDPIFRAKYAAHLPIILAHGATSITALAIGPVQFLIYPTSRTRRFHRALGYVYLTCIAVGAVTGFYMGTLAFGGVTTQLAFILFAIGWLWTGWLALDTARHRDIPAHRRWMIRNYAFTFGAATLRIYLNVFQWCGLDFVAIYPYTAWLGWVPNLLFAEYLIRRTARRAIPA